MIEYIKSKAVNLPDMEINGVYFPEEVKSLLEEKRKEMVCEYSGLPSLLSYLDEQDYYLGHS